MKLFISDFYGKRFWQKDTIINIKSLASACYYSFPIESIIYDTTIFNKIFFAAELYINDSLASQSIHYFVSPKLLKLPKTKIERSYIISDNNIKITLSSNTLAKNVFMKSENPNDIFSDNYFDLLPGENKTINLGLSMNEHKFKKRKLKIITYQ